MLDFVQCSVILFAYFLLSCLASAGGVRDEIVSAKLVDQCYC